MKIIDSHVHIYPDKIAGKASASIGGFYDMPIRYDGTVSRLLEICRRNGITECVACSVATSPEQVSIINDYISSVVTGDMQNLPADAPGFTGLAALHPDMSAREIEAELARAEALGLAGIKLHPDIQCFAINDPKVFHIYEQAAGKLPILFHTGDKRYNYSNPQKLADVMKKFPELTAVGAHFGGWSEWEDVNCLAGFGNLYVDTSSSMYTLSLNETRSLIKLFTPERVMFGTDYPMWDADGELERIDALGLTGYEKELILYENARRLYNI